MESGHGCNSSEAVLHITQTSRTRASTLNAISCHTQNILVFVGKDRVLPPWKRYNHSKCFSWNDLVSWESLVLCTSYFTNSATTI